MSDNTTGASSAVPGAAGAGPGAPSAASAAPSAASRGAAVTALITGLGSLVVLIIFMAADLGAIPMWIAVALGLLGIIFGIIALRRRQAKAMAVIGLITGAVTVLTGLALFAFAMIFVGALLSLGV